MKKQFLILECVLALFYTAAWTQPHLYGTTSKGGANDDGVLFLFKPATKTYEKLYDFDSAHFAQPVGSLVQTTDGKLYGVAALGGSKGYGVLFSYNSATAVLTKVWDFDSTTGKVPNNSLVIGLDNKLYGTTRNGGSHNMGVLFSFDPLTTIYTKRLDFDSTNGTWPLGDLTQASNGALYGVTNRGGVYNKGVLFSFNPASNAYVKWVDFDSTQGMYPVGSLMAGHNGILYGTAAQGGAYDGGTLFSFNTAAGAMTTLFDFGEEYDPTSMGGHPYGKLAQASNGKLYGTAGFGGHHGGGVLFSFDPPTSKYNPFWHFDYYGGGYDPTGHLMVATDGMVYGMTSSGGDAYAGDSSFSGVIFTVNPATDQYDVSWYFQDPSGSHPVGSGLVEYKAVDSLRTWYQDADEDGYGNPDVSKEAGEQPEGYVSDSNDCDDANSQTHPGATDLCDQEDNDCDGEVDEDGAKVFVYLDQDQDGYGEDATGGLVNECDLENLPPTVDIGGDCNDQDATVHPDATDVCGDGKDNNCNGVIDEGCTVATITCPGNQTFTADAGTCTALVKSLPPESVSGALELQYSLSGATEGSGDGEIRDQVFNIGVTTVHYTAVGEEGSQATCAFTITVKAAPEVCGDGIDNDCDGKVDEDCNTTTWYRDADGDGYGNANSTKEADEQPGGYVANSLDCNDKNKTKGGPEVCDGRDNDCDGVIDNGFNLQPFYSDWDGDGYGTPKRTVMACSAPQRFTSNSEDLNDDNGTVYPGALELCDGRDNNQNGQIDEGFTRTTFYHDFDKDGYGRSTVTLLACAAPLNYVAQAGDCNDRDAAIHPQAKGGCNGIDDDCDGLIDEWCRITTMQQKGQERDQSEVSTLQLSATPNPATHYFILHIQSASSKAIRLRVTDAAGRLIEVRGGVAANGTITIGNNYTAGVYVAEVLQEGTRAAVKLVKTLR